MKILPVLAFILSCSVAVITAGCAVSGTARFYVLSPTEHPHRECPGGSIAAIRIAPVEVPRYVDRPQLVFRRTDTEIDLAETSLWAEPLKEAIPRVLALDLRAMLCADILVDSAKRSHRPDFLLTVSVNRLDGTPGGQTVLDVTWTITDEREKKDILLRTSRFTEPMCPDAPHCLPEAYSRLLAAFSREIAAAFSALGLGAPRPGG